MAKHRFKRGKAGTAFNLGAGGQTAAEWWRVNKKKGMNTPSVGQCNAIVDSAFLEKVGVVQKVRELFDYLDANQASTLTNNRYDSNSDFLL